MASEQLCNRKTLRQTDEAGTAGENRYTPLHRASFQGDPEVVRCLVDHGADINARDTDNWTPLYMACRCRRFETAQALLELGADPNICTTDRHTPLHWACEIGVTDYVRILLQHGADPRAKDRSGTTPFDDVFVLDRDNPAKEEILDLFRQYAPDLVMERYCTTGPGR